MLNQVFKARWVAALLSGKYTQGIGRLRSHNGDHVVDQFCCLGVACDLWDPLRWEGCDFPVPNWGAYDDDTGKYLPYPDRDLDNYDTAETQLPDIVREKIGLTTDVQQRLAEANDGGATFEQIADWIEREAWHEVTAFNALAHA